MDFEVVIVGSGFGGSVMAYRLAKAGYKVCVLERGKSYPPGSFPRSPLAMQNNFWDPSKGLQGLYNVWSFRGSEALVASGLGGGSLIYANVLLRKDTAWFTEADLIGRDDLNFHYDNVEAMLKPQKYPLDFSPYNKTPKTLALKFAAEELMKQNPQNIEWMLPNLAVMFAADQKQKPALAEPLLPDSHNIHKLQRYTCRLCGECDIGCNYGSKNTLDHTYLSEAVRLGAEIRTRCEVRSFRPGDEAGYVIDYVVHEPENEGREFDTAKLPLKTITSDKLVLAAGTLGTTYLLLKNRKAFNGRLSKTLGTRYCGNGDLLTFVMKSKITADGKKIPRVINANYGPVITSAIRG
ncbi:MAG TPA: GMC family oxidoreductase N-terminal domain-containing protein, partial [Pyrinomonadaceae bacterium]